MDSASGWKARFARFEKAWRTFYQVLGRCRAAPDDEAMRKALLHAFGAARGFARQTVKEFETGTGGAPGGGLFADAEEAARWEEIARGGEEKAGADSGTETESVVETYYPLMEKLYRELKRRCGEE